MNRSEIERIVDLSFDRALGSVRPDIEKELYPGAFTDPSSWLRVKAVFNLQSDAMRAALKETLSEILAE